MPRILLPVGALLAVAAASARAQSGAPAVTAVCYTGTATCKAPPYVLPVRRGATTGVVFKGRALAAVAQRNIVVSAPSSVTATRVRGYPCGDVECLELSVAVAPAHDLDASRTVRFTFRTDSGAYGTANLLVLRLGRIESVSATPASPPWGTPVSVTVRGTDIGGALVTVASSAVSNVASRDDQLTFVATASGAPLASTGFTVRENAAAPVAETMYRPTTPGLTAIAYGSGVVACAAPALLFPIDGASVTLQEGKASIGWRTVTGSHRYAYELTPVLEVTQASREAIASGATLTPTTTTSLTSSLGSITGYLTLPTSIAGGVNVSTSAAVSAGRKYRWRVRAADCGDAAPWSAARTFTAQ